MYKLSDPHRKSAEFRDDRNTEFKSQLVFTSRAARRD